MQAVMKAKGDKGKILGFLDYYVLYNGFLFLITVEL